MKYFGKFWFNFNPKVKVTHKSNKSFIWASECFS